MVWPTPVLVPYAHHPSCLNQASPHPLHPPPPPPLLPSFAPTTTLPITLPLLLFPSPPHCPPNTPPSPHITRSSWSTSAQQVSGALASAIAEHGGAVQVAAGATFAAALTSTGKVGGAGAGGV